VTDFQWPIRIYYEDTDSGGVVYYANYLKFMERARTEWLRSLALEQDELTQNYGVLFAVKKVEIDYKIPARFNESLIVNTKIKKVSGASIELNQIITRMSHSSTSVICEANIKIVSLHVDSFTPCALPDKITSAINL